MTGQDVLTLLMSRLGNRVDPSLRSLCLLEMNLAQETVLEGGPTLPWFIVAEETELTTTPGDRRVHVPDNFIRQVDEEKPMYYRTAEEADFKLVKRSFEEAMDWHSSIAEGTPQDYAMRGDYFILFPKPDKAYTLVLPGYYARQTDIADNASENAWLKWAADLVLATAGVQIAEKHVQLEPGLVQSFKQDIINAYDRLNRMEVAREEAARDRRMG